jgi:photosynthetic reaction center cytochrome c subunit
MNTRHLATVALLAAAALGLASCERPPIDTVQRGYRGLAMGVVANPRTEAELLTANYVAPPSSPEPGADGGPLASSIYTNVQVLKDLNVAQFSRLMVAMSEWVAPADQACAYCHTPGEELSSDSNYRKVVARQMLAMTRHINGDWQHHVAKTGVTCYTCHRGNAVPKFAWTQAPPQDLGSDFAGNRDGQNAPSMVVGLTAMPNDPFTTYLNEKATNIRVISATALPMGSTRNIKQTEASYGLMIHMSQALGQNCTFCHNSRSFAEWDQSTPQRATAWHGIRMVRDVNEHYLKPLTGTFPANRKGPLGDVAKVNCETCHQGAYKPLLGQSQLADYPELLPPAAPAATAAPAGK